MATKQENKSRIISKLSIIAAVAYSLGRITSVFGLSRALSSTTWRPALLWWSAVVAFSCCLIWQLSGMIISYYSYRALTVVSESTDNPVFPAVTICKTAQMNNLKTNAMNLQTYVNVVNDMIAEWPHDTLIAQTQYSNVSSEEYMFVKWYLSTPQSYYSALPLDVSTMENVNQNSDPVAYCMLTTWDTSPQFCTGTLFKIRWDHSNYMCYSTSFSKKYNKQTNDMTVVLYLDDFEQPSNLDGFPPNRFWSMSPGVRVAVHDQQVPPDMTRAIAVGPGTEMNVLISQFDRNRLSTPYPGNCTTITQLGDTTDKLGYTSTHCKEVCLQDLIVAQCRCVNPTLVFTNQQLRSVNHRVCGNLTAIIAEGSAEIKTKQLKMFEDVYCMSVVWYGADQTNCSTSCPKPCTERLYSVTTSASGPWPHPSFELGFYKSLIKDYPMYGDKFSVYETILNDLQSNRISRTEAANRVRQLDLIHRNFIQLNFAFAEQRPYVISDTPQTTISELLSNVGGTFSLWLGMTVMCLVEAVELIFKIVYSMIVADKKKPVGTAQAVE